MSFAIATISIAAVATFAQGNTVWTFASVPWLTSGDRAKQILVTKGYSFAFKDSDGDLRFKGRLLDYPPDIIGYCTPAGLVVKWQMFITVPNDEARKVYQRLKEQYTQKYGQPSNAFEYFRSPYEEGDGYESTAFAVGKATFTPGRIQTVVRYTWKLQRRWISN